MELLFLSLHDAVEHRPQRRRADRRVRPLARDARAARGAGVHRGRGLAARRADDPAPLEVKPAQLELELVPARATAPTKPSPGSRSASTWPSGRLVSKVSGAQPSPPPIAFASASLRHQIRSSSTCRSASPIAARSPAVNVRSMACERRAVRSTSTPTSTPADRDHRAIAGVGEVEAQSAPGSSGLPCGPSANRSSPGATDSSRARTVRSAARATIQRAPSASRAARSRSSSLSSASSSGRRAGGCASSTDQTCTRDVCNRLLLVKAKDG